MNILYARVRGNITIIAISVKSCSKMCVTIASGSVSMLIPIWFSIPSVDGKMVEINSANLKYIKVSVLIMLLKVLYCCLGYIGNSVFSSFST